MIRAAGDWTSAFVRNLAEGDTLRLSGGYGRFLPQVGPRRPEQLWVAGGVGITPFLAALEKMEPDGNARVTLIYCIRSRETAGVLDAVEAHAARLPQLALNVVAEADAKRDFTVRLAEIIREMSGTSQAYLCGPKGLKHLVETTWNAQGKTGTIHSERFDFRGAYSLADVIYVGTPLMKTARSLTKTKVRMANAPAGS
ncbi:hypothetical protein ACS3SW_06130 [Roseobacteraceae bacterium S113]